MLVKVYSTNDPVHYWNYENFKEAHNARPVKWKMEGNYIYYIVYETNKELSQEALEDNGLSAEIIDSLDLV